MRSRLRVHGFARMVRLHVVLVFVELSVAVNTSCNVLSIWLVAV